MDFRRIVSGFLAATAMAAVTLAAAPAGAAIVTSALMATGTNDLQCRVVNASRSDVTVLIEIVDDEGVVLASHGPGTIFPGWTQSAVTADAPGVGYCRVTGVPRSRARVTLCVRDLGGTCISAVTGAS